MTSYHYTDLPGSHRTIKPGAVETGPADAAEPITVTLHLKPPANAAGHPLLAGIDPADLEALKNFADHHSLTIDAVNPLAQSIKLSGTVGQFAEAFQVRLANYNHPDGAFRGRVGAVKIPAELQDIVKSVHGLDNRAQAHPHFRLANPFHAHAHAAGNTSYTPVQLAKAYDFPAGNGGAGQTIGILELGGGFSQTDLNTYFNTLKLGAAPTVGVKLIDGATNTSDGPNGADGEVMLDAEVTTAIAPKAKTIVYFAPNTDQGFIDCVDQQITDGVNVISISWGSAESTWTAQSMQTLDQSFERAGALGITVTVAAGDNGSTDGVTDGKVHVDFPASSPHVLACGGTNVQISNGTITREVVWNGGANDGATGGGVSEVFPLPDWQSGTGVPVSAATGFAGRGMPDVSGDADPASGYQVRIDGQDMVIGGTSAVAPLWAGQIALINSALGKPVGFINPLLSNPALRAGFNDIVSGNNDLEGTNKGDYPAGPGWDASSGWGTPKGNAFLTGLKSLTPTA